MQTCYQSLAEVVAAWNSLINTIRYTTVKLAPSIIDRCFVFSNQISVKVIDVARTINSEKLRTLIARQYGTINYMAIMECVSQEASLRPLSIQYCKVNWVERLL